jgi:SSS family solute:Na+ symporter
VAPTTYVVNFQLAGGVWMLQVLPAVLLALFLTWLNGRAAVAGWVVGMAIGTWLLLLVHFKTTSYSVDLFGRHVLIYIGILAVLANIVVALLGSAIGAAARRHAAASLSPLTP